MLEVLSPFWVVIFFFFGALLGSFANVIILRLPLEQSIAFPGSHCFRCQAPVRWFDNIPILSWLILKGRCRQCGQSFSFRYLLVELLMASLFAITFYKFGFSWTIVELLIFVFGLVVCTFIDFDHMILPDEFTLGGLVVGLLGALLNPERDFLSALGGAAMGGGFFFAMAYIYFLMTKNEGLGGGDIKLAAWIGALLGWKAIPFVIMSAAIIGSLVGISMALFQKKDLKTAIPFGPYLALGALLYIFGAQPLSDWYFAIFLPEF